jgi:hypothetical protein
MISQQLSTEIIRQKKTMITLDFEFNHRYSARLIDEDFAYNNTLPMMTINEVPVHCALIAKKNHGKWRWTLNVETVFNDTSLYREELVHIESHYVGFKLAIKKIQVIIPRLVFHKATSQFKDSMRMPVECLLLDEMSGTKNCSIAHDKECVVCYDDTRQKTPCGHILCVPCWGKIHKAADRGVHCPICRKCMNCEEEENDCDCD